MQPLHACLLVGLVQTKAHMLFAQLLLLLLRRLPRLLCCPAGLQLLAGARSSAVAVLIGNRRRKIKQDRAGSQTVVFCPDRRIGQETESG